MEENLEIVETLLNGIEPYFPITDVKTAADAVSYLLLESDGEPNVAVVTLLMCLVKEAVLQSPQDRKKLIVNDRLIFMSPIPLTTFRETWNSFLMIVKDVNKTVAQKTSRGRRAAETSPATIIAIYKFITERVAVGNEKSTIGGRSGMLHFISATENPPKNLRGSRAFLDFSEVKELTVMISQLLGLTDVHLNLSESMVFVGIGKPDELGKNLVGIPEHESGFLPRGSRSTAFAGLPPVTDLWVCSKGQFVDCDRFLEIAYLCTAMQQDYTADGFNEVLGEFQLLVLNILYADHKMNKFPMGLTIYGILESFINEKQSGNKSVVEKLLRQAIRTNQDNYANAFVFPYCYFVKYLIRTEEYVTALVPAELASSAACQYAYVSNLDQVLYKEMFSLAKDHIRLIVQKPGCLENPSTSSLILAFIDNICVWEEKSKTSIWHSTWSETLIGRCLHKLANDSLRSVVIHSSMVSFREHIKHPYSPAHYLEEMISNLRNPSRFRSMADIVVPYVFPDGLVIDESFCRFALRLYSQWPPLRATKKYLVHGQSLIELPTKRSLHEAKYDTVMKTLRRWPVIPGVSDEDLKRISSIREVNPLYQTSNGQLFPFVDMGPPNVAMYCFDFKKIKEEILVPVVGTLENRVMAALHERLAVLEAEKSGITRISEEPHWKMCSHVLLQSQKMKNLMSMLTSDRFNAAEIRLKLEGCGTDNSSEKRARRPPTRQRDLF